MKNILLTTILTFCGTIFFGQTTETFTTSGTWIVPCGVSSVTVECWGGGGAGSGDNSNDFNSTGYGGGGGGYVTNTISVTPGNTINYTVGLGGSGGLGNGSNGGNSFFNIVLANGGSRATTSSVGTGGGGSGGTLTWGVDGNSPTGMAGGDGGAGGNGGAGGAGAAGGADGGDGNFPGGGGGGAGDSSGGGQVGGNGGNGQIKLTYTIVDNPPTGTAPADLSVQCSGDVPAADPMLITDEADDCDPSPIVTWVSDVTDGNSNPETITRTYRIEDANSNFINVTQTITVQDTEAPTGTAPANLSVECSGDVPAADPMLIVDEADNCTSSPIVTFEGDATDGMSCPETITRTYRITDDEGNFTDLTQLITVQDTEAPTASNPMGIGVETVADIPAADPFIITDESDNCSPAPIVAFVSDVSDGLSCPETFTRTYSVTDDCGNSTNVQQIITVLDMTAPVMGTAPANISVECSADVPAMTTLSWTDNADGAGTVSGTDVSDNGSCPEIITRTWVYTDMCGNQAVAATQTITINDTQAPTATAPGNVTVACNADIPAVNTGDVLNVADNCTASPVVAHVSDASDNNTSPEVITRTYSITDDCGNSTTVQQFITVSAPTCGTPSCLLAQYDFTGNADDASGNGNHGTVNGATLTTDRFGNANSAYSFDGVDDYIGVQSNSSLENFNNTISISSWININQFYNNRFPIMEKSSSFDADFSLVQHGNGFSNNELNFQSIQSSSAIFNAAVSNAVGLNQWYHYLITYDGNEVGVYLNGSKILGYLTSSNLFSSSDSLFIGKAPFGVLEFANGKIDDIKILGCALDPVAVDSIYQAEAPAINCGFGLAQNITQPTCNNSSNGAIDLMVGGGQAPIEYTWSNGATTQDVSNLQPGNYSVIITDANGCDTSRTFTVAPANIVGISVNVNDATCGNSDGSAFVSVNQGTAPYQYSITSGDTTNIAQDLAAGYYSATVTDANGCSASKVFVVSDSDGPSVNGMEIEPSCPDDTDGGVNVAVVGGTTPYDFQWSDGSTTEDISGVGAGIYDLEVTDANGCVAMASFELTGGTPINLGAFTYSNPTCGNQDGEIAVSATGGNGNLSYQWSMNTGGQTTPTAINLGAGAYYLSVTDDNGCSQTQSYMLSNVTGPTAIIQSIYPVACNGNGGGINLSVTGGVPPFTYQWSNGATSQDLQGIAIGAYDVMVTDGNGCSDMITANVAGKVPEEQEICLITVDSLTQTNLLVWEKPSTPEGVEFYKIYREGNATGVYNLADTVHYSSVSEWTDPIADPSVRGWRYKIAAVDSCGNESAMSTYHKSIHLTINQGVGNVFNLIWDGYVGQTIPSWIIERYHPSTGWINIDTIPSNLHSYTDNNAPAQGNNLDYAVYGEPNGGCTSSRAQSYGSTRSNKSTIAAVDASYINEMGDYEFNLYPNPADNTINISTNFGETYEVVIYDLHGKLITRSMQNGNTEMSVDKLTSGIYFVEIIGGDEELSIFKLVKK